MDEFKITKEDLKQLRSELLSERKKESIQHEAERLKDNSNNQNLQSTNNKTG